MSRYLRLMAELSRKPADFAPGPVVNSSPPSGDNRTSTPDDDRSPTTGQGELWMAEGANGVFTGSRIIRIQQAQDALTHREEKVYDVLWGTKSQVPEPHRLKQIGYSELCSKARVDRRTVVRLVDRLIEKGYIAIERPSDARTATPTLYRVLSYGSVLRYQRETGRLWALKTGTGVFYARRLERPVVSSSPTPVVIRSSTTDDSRPSPPVVAIAQPPVVSSAPYKEGSKDKALSSSSEFPVIADAAARHGLALDDDAIRRLSARCRDGDEQTMPDEIAYFVELKLNQLRNRRDITNWAGMLLHAVPAYFTGQRTELARYRAGKARERDEQRRVAQSILDDPGAAEDDRALARRMLAELGPESSGVG